MEPIPSESSALPADMRISHERGPMTRQIRETVLREQGAAAWEALLAAVSPACRARFAKPIGYFEWVESELALELHGAWMAQRGGDGMGARGEDAAREILGGAHRWLLRLATPSVLIQAFPKLYGFYYQGGRVEVDAMEEGRADISVFAWGYPESWFQEGLGAWVRVALDLTGAPGVTVVHAPPEPGDCRHRYQVRWGAPTPYGGA